MNPGGIFFESSCSSSLKNRKPQPNDGTLENFVAATAAAEAVPSFSFVFPGGAFSPAYKREYTAVPLAGRGRRHCICTQRVFTARSAGQKRSYILAWLGIDWLEQARRSASVGGLARVGSGALGRVCWSRTRRDWSKPRADWSARPDDGSRESSPRGLGVYT